MKPFTRALAPSCLAAALLMFAASFAPLAIASPQCDKDNGGITLPPGFCAEVVADNIGTGRHAVVAPNGDLFVALQNGGIAALHDSTGNGRFDVVKKFGTLSTTGIAFHDGYLYFATHLTVERYKWAPGQLVPTGPAQIVVSGFPNKKPEHADKGLTFDDSGHLYVNVGNPSNACQVKDRFPHSPGIDPCPLLKNHGGIWRYDANRLNQTEMGGVRFGTGMRQFLAITWHNGSIYVVMNNRDQLNTLWPKLFTAEENATLPVEPMYLVTKSSNFGWPYCFYSSKLHKLVLNPEYGGNGTKVGRCSQYDLPIATYPAHWAPMDIMFYTGHQFPAKYRKGAFIAFHGSWNRAPIPQAGYNVVFQPFDGKKPSGPYQIFANGFKGKKVLENPSDALARPNGLAQAPDGSLYIIDSQHGKIWRVFYHGKARH